MFDVYGIGNAIMDLQIHAEEDDIRRFGLTKASMQLVGVDEQQDLINHFGGKPMNQASGGSAANSMIAVAQLGGKAAYGCLVGDDSFGSFYYEELEALGVVLHNAPVRDGATGTCVILITPDAERTMNTNLGTSAAFGPAHINEELLSSSRWLYIEGYLFSSEPGRLAIEHAISLAKRHGVRIALTFSDGFIVECFKDAVEPAVAAADLIFANTNEAMKYSGIDDEERAFGFLCSTIPNVVMTKSERGASVFFGGERYEVAALPTKAIDDTGAGDMFAGAFLYGVTQGRSGKYAAELGCFLASRVVSQMGARLGGDVRAITANFHAKT